MRISDWSSDVCSSDLSDRYEDILAALEKDGGEWAAKELDALHTKSPQTCKVALRQLREGAAMPDFAAEMAQEYAIGSRVVQMHDFLEGVRALIVDKDTSPKWDPPTAEAVKIGRAEGRESGGKTV